MRSRAKNDPSHPAAEDSLRSFLQCGIPRFGVARFRCKNCGDSRFVPFSCKRRMACPSCDAKRAVLESGHALDDLLPDVPYRQWVLVLPKRLRYFIHRDPRLIGAIDEVFARTLADFLRKRSSAPKGSAPAQFHAIQRFGSSVNLHVHVDAALSDGCFSFDGGVLKFHPAPPPSVVDLADLIAVLRKQEMLSWPHSGFALDAGTRIGEGGRAALQRLLLYFLRPAAEIVGRLAAIVPPPKKHVVRYCGALGPRSPLRGAVTTATRVGATLGELERGYAVTPAGKIVREVRRAAKAAGRAAALQLSVEAALPRAIARSWAACVRKVFEVDPVRCGKCGGEMKLVSVILDDRELARILAHQGWPTEFPKTRRYQDFLSGVCAGPEGFRPRASRAPPGSVARGDEGSQSDPGEQWEGRQEFTSDWPA